MGLSEDRIIVLVGATSMGAKWKGLDLFVKAMIQPGGRSHAIRDDRIQVVTVGKDAFEVPQLTGLVEVEHFGQHHLGAKSGPTCQIQRPQDQDGDWY